MRPDRVADTGVDENMGAKMIFASNPLYCLKPFHKVLEMLLPHVNGWEFLAEKEHSWDNREHMKDVLSTTDMKVQLHAPFNDVNLASMNPRIVEASILEIERTFQLATLLDSDMVTIHPGIYSPLGRFWDGAKPRAHESLKRLYILSKEYGITCALENMPDLDVTMGVTPDEIQEFLQSSGLSLCLDVGHAYTSGRLIDFLDMDIVPVNLHLHDNIGGRDEHRTLGDGEIDFESSLKKLDSYEGNYVIEGRSLESILASKLYLEELLDKF